VTDCDVCSWQLFPGVLVCSSRREDGTRQRLAQDCAVCFFIEQPATIVDASVSPLALNLAMGVCTENLSAGAVVVKSAQDDA
jgi:hypothetical protein